MRRAAKLNISLFSRVKSSKNLLPVIILAYLVFIFFWKFFLKNLVPVPTDITVGMYFPWLDYKWGFEAGVPVKNSILSDVVSVLYPIKSLAMDMLKNGKAPLWNPYMFGGYPLLANFQIGIFNPTNILYFFLPNLTAWSLQVVMQSFLAAIFTFLFLRHLKLNRFACLLGAVTYTFSGSNIIWLEWNAHTWTAAFLPILLFLTDKYFQQPQKQWGLLLTLAVTCQIFVGYPQMAMYSYGAMFLLVVLRHKIWQKATIFWLGFVALGVILAGIQLLPAAELLSTSQRQHEVLEKDTANLSWMGLISLWAPDYFGNHSTLNFWGIGNYTNNVGYTGIVAIIFSSIAIWWRRKEIWAKYFLVLAVVSLLFSLPTPFIDLFRQLKFIGFAAASATRILFLFNFSLACLSAMAMDYLIYKKPEWRWIRATYLPVIVLSAFFVASGISYYFYRFSGETVTGFWGPANLRVGLRNLAWPFLITLVSGGLLILANLSHRVKKMVLVGFFGLTAVELFRFGWKYLPFSRAEFLFPSTPIIDYVKKQPGIFRVDGGDAIPMNMWLPYQMESLAAYDAVYPVRTAKFISAVNGGSIQNPQGRHGSLHRYDSRLLDLSNVCYFLAVKNDEQLRPDYDGSPVGKFQLKKLVPVFEDKRVVVLKNNDCLPRAWMAGDYEIKTGQEIIDRLVDPSFDLSKKVILESEPKVGPAGKQTGGKATITWRQNEANQQLIEVDSADDGFLVTSDSFYPGWAADVDGQATEIYPADYNFRAIYLPAGKHLVHFNYQPVSVTMGMRLSLVGLIICGGLLTYGYFKKHKSA
ncbi:MAG: YfhO family protein [Candidatus Shapirobacteria bacterium]|jgi:hypothetical protein